MRTILVLGALGAVSIFAVGCSGSKPSSSTDPHGIVSASLRRAHDCVDLLAMLQEDALSKMNTQIDAQERMIEDYYDQGFGFGGAPEANAGASGAQGTGGATSGDHATSHSDTNTQVAGVDEADIVKTDGKYIYLLHGQSFVIANAWPASTLAQSSSVAIEGEPSEMFVANGQAVVYSTVDGTAIYAAAGLTPRSSYYDGYYGPYAYGGADIACGGPAGGGCYGFYQNALTKITVLSVQDAGAPQVTRELYFEGSYQDSRRVDGKVRTILGGGAHGPLLQYYPEYSSPSSYPQTKLGLVQAYEDLRAKNAAAIRATTVNDWLPYSMVKSGGAISAQAMACGDMYVPTAGSTEYGMTQIASIDLGSPDAAPRTTAIMGAVDTVYSSQDTMVLAARAWIDPWWYMVGGYAMSSGGAPSSGSGSAGSGTVSSGSTSAMDQPLFVGPSIVTTTYTQLHMFDLDADPTLPTYVASGTVVGATKDQFSIDVSNGTVRVATNESRMAIDARVQPPASQLQANHVFTLAPQGSKLAVVGDAGEIAPGESLYSTRFVGDTAYVVTFRQIDPLFVVDLSNAAKPRVVGSVTIPGFSNYMQPIDAGHLLTIGQDVQANEPSGLALEIFDVTNPGSPKLTNKLTFSGAGYGYSEAQYDHKAFTYFADRKLLTFPFYAYDNTNGTMRSSAEVFTVDASAGITHLGSVDHSPLFGQSTQGYCGGYFTPWIRRGVFLDNVLYSISYAGIVATDSSNMSASLATMKLASPTLPGYPGCAQ